MSRATENISKLINDAIELHREYDSTSFDDVGKEEAETRRQIARYLAKDEDHSLLAYTKPLVVVFGEARSGKTTEFRRTAKNIQNEGGHGFFIRLEDLALSGQPVDVLKSSLEGGTPQQLDAWLNSEEEAIFFLDAIDEAKLHNHSDFRRAIKTFQNSLGENLLRIRLFLSCRATEWGGKEDEQILRSIREAMGKFPESNGERSDARELFDLIEICPLNLEQVKRLSAHEGLKSTQADAFIETIEEMNALDFVSRPGDVKGHARIWQENGRFGTFTELVRTDIAEKLKETNDKHKKSDPLTMEKAIKGAEILAAASILCKESTFRYLSVENDTSDASSSLDPTLLLPDWSAPEVKALLGKPLFDEATYGRVRFHTRTVREYLASQWLLKRYQDGCPPSEIVKLLFTSKHGKTVAIPSRANLVAWLASDIPEVFNCALKYQPELLPDMGDPARFSLPDRRRIIESYAQRYKDRNITRFKYDPQGLRRFAQQDLSDLINQYLSTSNLPEHFKELLFDIIEMGKIGDCADNALAYALNEHEEIDIRMDAMRALKTCGQENHFSQIFDYIKKSIKVPDRFYAMALVVLYPTFLSPEDFLSLISDAPGKVTKPKAHLHDWMDTILDKENDPSRLRQLILGFMQLLGKPEFLWLRNGLGKLLLKWIEKGSLDIECFCDAMLSLDTDVDELRDRHRESIKKEFKKLYPEIRQRFFWMKYDSEIQKGTHENLIRYHVYADRNGLIELHENDIGWLLLDAVSKPDERQRILAFNAAIRIIRRDGVSDHLEKLNAAAATSQEIRESLDWYLAPPRRQPWDYANELRSAASKLQKEYVRLKLHQDALKDMPSISDASNIELLYRIFRVIDNPDKGTTTENANLVGELFGEEVKSSFLQGLQMFWRKWKIEETSRNGDTLALFSLEYCFENGFDFSSLSVDQVPNLVKLANRAYWLPRWFSSLISAFPNEVRKETGGLIDNSIQWEDQKSSVSSFLIDVAYSSKDIIKFFALAVFQRAMTVSPISGELRKYVIKILSEAGMLKELEEIVNREFEVIFPNEKIFWLAVKFQINATDGLVWFLKHVESLPDMDADLFAESLCGFLYRDGHSGALLAGKSDYQRPEILERFIPLVYKHIRPEEDLAHDGVYTPGSRDNAESFRGAILKMLIDSPNEEAYYCLLRLREQEFPDITRDYLLLQSEQRIARDGDKAWTVANVMQFANAHEYDPISASDLFEITRKRLGEIKDKLERGDYSQRELFKPDTHEDMYQKFTAERLEELSHNRYSVTREVEVDKGKKPDIRTYRTGLSPVSIEVKCAHVDHWSGNTLLRQLSEQLVEQYLKAENSRHGIFLLFNADKSRTWEINGLGKGNFMWLISCLQVKAGEIQSTHSGVDQLAVVGIDLTV